MKKFYILALSLLTGALQASASAPPAGADAPTAARPPMHTSISGARFYSWMGENDEEPAGWYRFDTDGSYTLQWTNIFSDYGINLTNGWMRGGRLCGLGVMSMGNLVYYYNYVEFNPATGEMLKEESVSPDNMIDMTLYYESCAYVPGQDKVFGYINNVGLTGYSFCSSPADDIGDITSIATLDYSGDRCNALCYNPEDNALYGVTFEGDFVRVDFDGTQTKIFNLDLEDLKNTKAALAYSPYDGCFLYTPLYYSYASQLYYIYPEQKQMRFIRNFPGANQFFFFLNEDYSYNPAAPAKPSLVAETLTAGALEGTWTLKMPVATVGGATLQGELKWELYVDNDMTASGATSPGDDVEIKVGPLSQGEHVIRVSCTDASGATGLPFVVSRYFGNGIPLAPEEVTLTASSVSWTPVDKAELDGYLEPGKMRYEVYINDRFIGSTTDTSMAIELDPEKEVTAYYAYVAASCNSQVSERTRSNKLIFGAPFPLPYTVVPTKEQAELTVTFNLDGSPDYGTWEFWQSRWPVPVFASGWSYEKADDWLILPPVDCPDISHAYRVTLQAVNGGSKWSGNDEHFEVWCGDAPQPEAMTTLVMPDTKVNNVYEEGFETFSNLFVPKKPGKTYIAIRSVSPPDQYSLVIHDITVEATDEPANVPAAPSDFRVTGKSDADLTADITLTVPTRTITGETIADGADLKVKVGVGEKWSERDVTPGQTVTMTVGTYQGDNRLTAYCALDGQNGQEISATIFTGTIPPNYIEDFETEVSRDNMSVRMTWQPPLGGQENLEGYYSPEGMHYWLMEMIEDPVYGEYEWTPVKDLGDVLEYTYTLPEGSPLEIKYLGIAAANAGGVSDAIWYTYHEIGTPYKPEIHEDFTVGNGPGFNYRPLRAVKISDEYDSSWELMQPEEMGLDLWNPDVPYAMINYSNTEESGAKGYLQLPKFSTVGVKDPGITLTVWTSEPCNVPVSIYAATYDSQRMQKIGDIPMPDDGWQDLSVMLPEQYQDVPWVQLAINTTLPTPYSYFLLGGYRIGTVDVSATGAPAAAHGFAYGGKGGITVVGAEGESVVVTSLDGRVAATVRKAGAAQQLPLAPGFYIVTFGNNSQKVIVR